MAQEWCNVNSYNQKNDEMLSGAINEMKQFDKYSWHRLVSAREHSIKTLNECAHYLDKVSKDTSIAKVSGGGVGVAGGIVSIVGLALLNPIVVAVGVCIAAGGSVTSLTGALIKAGWTNSKQNEAMAVTKLDQELFGRYANLDKNLRFQIKKSVSKIRLAANAVTAGVSTTNAINGMVLSANGMKLLAMGTIPAELSGDVAKQLIYSPKIAGLITVEAAGFVSKAFVIGGTALSLVVGLWEITSGAKELNNGYELADEMRKKAHELRENFKIIKKTHQDTMNAINDVKL